MHTLDYILVGSYLLLILVLGLRAGRKVHDLRQFSTAGGQYGALVVFATLSASYIGGGFTMGNAGEVYLIGIANVVAIWGFSIKELLVGFFLAPRMDRFPGAMSAGDITQAAYGTGAKVLTGVFGVLLCMAIVGAQVGAMGAVFSLFLGMHPLLGIAIGCSILIAYSTLGGMRAVVVTDLVQFAFLSIGLPLVLVFGVIAVGGLDEVAQALPEGHLSLFHNLTPVALLSMFLVLMFGEALVPPYLQRLMIGQPRQVARGTIWSGIFSFPFFLITGCIGLLALALNADLETPNHAIPYVIGEVLPLGIRGLVVAGIISVSMSSADSFLNSAAVCFSHDVVAPLSRRPIHERAQLILARLTTLVVGAGAVVVAISIEGLLQILFYAYNFWAPVILVPIIAAFFGCRARSWVVFAAAAAGILANLGWTRLLVTEGGPLGGTMIGDLDGLIPGILANAIVFFILVRASNRRADDDLTAAPQTSV